jgi:hypothetical protein
MYDMLSQWSLICFHDHNSQVNGAWLCTHQSIFNTHNGDPKETQSCQRCALYCCLNTLALMIKTQIS